MKLRTIALAAGIALVAVGCSKPQGGYRIYVSNESSGDMTIIDSTNTRQAAPKWREGGAQVAEFDWH